MSGELPEAYLRFEPQSQSVPGAVGRCVVVVGDRDVAELQVGDLRYEQEGASPGRWWVGLFADSEDPLRQTARFGR